MTPKIIRSTEGLALMGGRQTIKIKSEDTDEKMSIIFSMIPAGSGIPVHVHSREVEMFVVSDGELEVTLNGKVHVLRKGDMVFMPKNVPHGFKAIKDTSMWVTLVPGGAEKMFVALAGLPGGPPDMRQVRQICDEYGVKFV
ncbi:MAG: cupin domain-containing protein [Flavipsychrobacter sp.]|nr:cupin domain-containing protein [Flavipsychrobacter sp.]